jgi:hypothetical protein
VSFNFHQPSIVQRWLVSGDAFHTTCVSQVSSKDKSIKYLITCNPGFSYSHRNNLTNGSCTCRTERCIRETFQSPRLLPLRRCFSFSGAPSPPEEGAERRRYGKAVAAKRGGRYNSIRLIGASLTGDFESHRVPCGCLPEFIRALCRAASRFLGTGMASQSAIWRQLHPCFTGMSDLIPCQHCQLAAQTRPV